MSTAQKGYLPFEGHSFLIESTLEDSKRRRKDVRIVRLDLKNVIGSVPHHTMWEMMNALRVPSHFTRIYKEIYANSTQRVRSSDGLTDEIRITHGIKQGCPLSPLLFNLVLDEIRGHPQSSHHFKHFTMGNRPEGILKFKPDNSDLTPRVFY